MRFRSNRKWAPLLLRRLDLAQKITPAGLSCLLLAAGFFDVHFAAAHFGLIGFNLALGRAAYHASGHDVELRAVPWTLHRTADQSAIEKRAALVGATVGDGEDAILAKSGGDALTGNRH